MAAGVPLKPMLAKICEGIPDALRQLSGDFLAEFKYDGMRSQIHLLPDGSVRVFSRNCELSLPSERASQLLEPPKFEDFLCRGGWQLSLI